MSDVLDRIGVQLRQSERSLHLAAAAPAVPRAAPGRRRRLRGLARRHFALVAALVAASGTAGGIAIADSLGGPALDDQQYFDEGRRAVPETAMTPDQTALLGILRRPVTPADAMPPAIAGVAHDNFPVGEYGASLGLARLAQESHGVGAWVIPANGGLVCLDAASVAASGPFQAGGPACKPVSAMSHGAIYEALGSNASQGEPTPTHPRPTLLAGLVPDGVTSVTLNLSGGVTESIPVHNNVYMATLDATGTLAGYENLGESPPPASVPMTISISFSGPTGTVTEPLGPQGVMFAAGS
jgi:hypothetical protein